MMTESTRWANTGFADYGEKLQLHEGGNRHRNGEKLRRTDGFLGKETGREIREYRPYGEPDDHVARIVHSGENAGREHGNAHEKEYGGKGLAFENEERRGDRSSGEDAVSRGERVVRKVVDERSYRGNGFRTRTSRKSEIEHPVQSEGENDRVEKREDVGLRFGVVFQNETGAEPKRDENEGGQKHFRVGETADCRDLPTRGGIYDRTEGLERGSVEGLESVEDHTEKITRRE